MSLDFSLKKVMPVYVFESNMTHNMTPMAKAAGLYDCLWRPQENGITHAAQLIEPLREGLMRLLDEPPRYMQLNPPNGWGAYENLVKFVELYLAACIEHPDASVGASRLTEARRNSDKES